MLKPSSWYESMVESSKGEYVKMYPNEEDGESESGEYPVRQEKPAWHTRHVPKSRLGLLCIAAVIIGLAFGIPMLFTRPQTGLVTRSPFSGAFSRIPYASDVSPKNKKITMVGMWNKDSFPPYLRHFFYTMQLNADSIDLVFINRVWGPEDKCIDFKKHGVDITWGGNIKVVCMGLEEWSRRYTDYVCSEKYGWNCNEEDRLAVNKEFNRRQDGRNFQWRLFRGWVFRDLLPDNPYWGWLDHDLFVGDFTRFPWNILSTMSIMSFHKTSLDEAYLAGQLTAFNFDDEELGRAFLKIPEMREPQGFINGSMVDESEETVWSWNYLSVEDDLPGTNLNYALIPHLQGDDWYDSTEYSYAISGRDILQISNKLNRAQIENLIQWERSTPVDEMGGVGWTRGNDHSDVLLTHPDQIFGNFPTIGAAEGSDHFDGVLESVKYQHGVKNCPAGDWIPDQWRICVPGHVLTNSDELWSHDPSILRSSVIHFKDQQAGYVFRRLERDTRHRGYGRKLVKHNQHSKGYDWEPFPPFDITDKHIYVYNHQKAEVFLMGENRDKTIYYRDSDKDPNKSIG